MYGLDDGTNRSLPVQLEAQTGAYRSNSQSVKLITPENGQTCLDRRTDKIDIKCGFFMCLINTKILLTTC